MLEHLSFRALQFISHTCPCLARDAFDRLFVVVVKIGVNTSSSRFLLALHPPAVHYCHSVVPQSLVLCAGAHGADGVRHVSAFTRGVVHVSPADWVIVTPSDGASYVAVQICAC